MDGTRGQRVPTLLPALVFYVTGIVCNSSSDALSISFAVLISRIAGKVGRVFARKVCGFRLPQRCGTRGQRVPTLPAHRFSTQPALKGGGNGGGCVIGVIVV